MVWPSALLAPAKLSPPKLAPGGLLGVHHTIGRPIGVGRDLAPPPDGGRGDGRVLNGGGENQKSAELLRPTWSCADIVFARSPTAVTQNIRKSLQDSAARFELLSNPNRPCHLPSPTTTSQRQAVERGEQYSLSGAPVVFMPASARRVGRFFRGFVGAMLICGNNFSPVLWINSLFVWAMGNGRDRWGYRSSYVVCAAPDATLYRRDVHPWLTNRRTGGQQHLRGPRVGRTELDAPSAVIHDRLQRGPSIFLQSDVVETKTPGMTSPVGQPRRA